MENYQGDLTDILRATGGSLSQQPDPSSSSGCWEFDRPPLITTMTTTTSYTPLLEEATGGRVSSNPASDFFGDPFCNMRDPLLHEFDRPTSTYFDDSATSTTIKVNEGSCNNINMFSRIQISPAPNNKSPLLLPTPPPQRSSENNNNNSNIPKSPLMVAMASPSPAGFKVAAAASGLVLSDRIINVSSSKSCLIDGPVQISSPRNLGIKRRKSQAKKVVCIPAPAAPNSRPSGEVVPSDLWAWRKYGQKPIKGSPYPRGYYRCSSSKGCPARKQVERSRTDPNMLVITYTSEHNHPWPTQRNALAGSTRAQPPKFNSVGSKINSPTTSHMKEESSNDEATLSPTNNNTNIGSGGASSSSQVKEELEEDGKQMEHENVILDDGFSYRPAMLDQDFFAELGEIDGDPLELLFSSSQGFIDEEGAQKQGNKGGGGLDPFGLFDWPSVDNQNSSSFGEAKRGL